MRCSSEGRQLSTKEMHGRMFRLLSSCQKWAGMYCHG